MGGDAEGLIARLKRLCWLVPEVDSTGATHLVAGNSCGHEVPRALRESRKYHPMSERM